MPANGKATNNLAYHQVTTPKLSIVDIFITCQAAKHRLTQKAHQSVDAILTLKGVPKKPNRLIETTKGFIKLPVK